MTVKGKAPEWIVLTDGQSFCNKPGTSGGALTWPSKVFSVRPHMWRNVALDGVGFDVLDNTAATRIHPFAVYALNAAAFLCGGQGDLVAGLTGLQTYTATVAYSDALRTAGFDVVAVMTMSVYPPLTGPQDTERLDYNSRLLASAAFDDVIDVAANATLQDGGNPTYYSGLGHWTDAATDIVKTIVDPYADATLGA